MTSIFMVTGVKEERDGFWARLNDDPKIEEFFHFGDIEEVFDTDKITFLGRTQVRPKRF